MVAMLVRPGAPCLGLSMRSTLNFTAAASKGSPLWNFTLCLSLDCQVVSLRVRQDSARLPSMCSVLRLRRRSVSKIWRSGSWAFLSQCMCQSRVAASPDCTITTGFGCAWAEGATASSVAIMATTRTVSCRFIVVLLRGSVSAWLELLQAASHVEIGIEGVAERVADEVDGHYRHEEGHPREEGEPVARVDVLPPLREHAAPGGNGHGHPEPKEGEPRLGEDGDGDPEGGHHHERRAHVEQDEREGQLHVGEPHHGVIGYAAAHAGEEAEGGAREPCDEPGGEPDEARRAGAVDEPAQDVAAQLIRPQHGEGAVGRTGQRRSEAGEEALLRRIDGRQELRDGGAEADHYEDRCAYARPPGGAHDAERAGAAVRQGGPEGRAPHRPRRSRC